MLRTVAWVLVAGLSVGCEASEADPVEPTPRAQDANAAEPEPRTDCPAPGPGLATRLGVRMSEICARTPVDPMGRDPAVDRELHGHWEGQYHDDGSAPVDFEADLSTVDGTITGSTSEPTTFGAVGYYSRLEAGLTGDAFASRQVVLHKTYRTGGVDHSVLYVGTLDASGRRIDGLWRVDGRRGTFWMERR